MPVRRPLQQSPVVVPRSSYYKTSARHDYGIDDSIDRVEYVSNAVLDETYDRARKSKNRDNELIRNTRAAIRPSDRDSSYSGESRTGRSTKRFRSLPPASIDSRSPSPTSSSIVPYRALTKARTSLSTNPSPSSLLSSKINSYLRGSSLPPPKGSKKLQSSISYKSFLVDPPRSPLLNDARATVSYRSYLSDPAVTSPFSTRGSSKVLHGYIPKSLVPYRPSRSRPPPVEYNADDDDYADEDVDDTHIGSYKRKYRILKTPISTPQYSDSASVNDEDDDDYGDVYYDASESPGTYSSPRPSGVSNLKLSSYDCPYDGSYEADMAEMYDYVPFGPSRQGILELTEEPSISPAPSITSTPSRLTAPEPEPSIPSVTTMPTYKHLDDSLTKTSFANNLLFDSIISSTAAHAKEAISQSQLPDYKNASLVLSVEGSAVSADGKNRYGFRYYPPPIPIKGSGIGLDERILGVAPKPVSPADSFLCKYLDRLRSYRSDVRDHVEKDDNNLGYSRGYSRGYSYSREPYRSSSSLVSRPITPYVHRTIHVPVHISGRQHSVPVSSYRSRLEDGQSHRVDVFPLVVSETSLPSDRKVHLPAFTSSSSSSDKGRDPSTRLTVLEKINIKAAIIGSKMDADAGAKKPPKRPKSDFAAKKLREFKIQDIERRYK